MLEETGLAEQYTQTVQAEFQTAWVIGAPQSKVDPGENGAGRQRMNRKVIPFAGLFVLTSVVVWVILGRAGEDEAMEQNVTAHTTLGKLKEITPVVGDPNVYWARLPMGKIIFAREGDVPGPTDLVLTAILDYGSEEAASAALSGTVGAAAVLDFSDEPIKYSWWPQTLLDVVDDGKFSAIEFMGVPGFGEATILKSETVPQYLVLRKPLM